MDKVLDMHSNFEKLLLTENFNAGISDHYMKAFLYPKKSYYLAQKSLQVKTCFKNISNPRFIDLFLTNNARSFQNNN